MKIKDAEGKEIEVFTQEELTAKTEEIKTEATKLATETATKMAEGKIEEFKTANPDKSTEIAGLQKEIEDLKTAAGLAGGEEEKTGQVARLLEKIDTLTTTVTTLQTSQEATNQRVIGDTKGDLLKRLSGGDEELLKKIELEFDSYKPDKTSKEDIVERMATAYKIVEGKEASPSLLDNVTNPGAGDHQEHKPDPTKIEFTDNAKAIGDAIGVTEKDRTDYQNKVNKENK